jgi:hypothetical protein
MSMIKMTPGEAIVETLPTRLLPKYASLDYRNW